MSVEMKLGRWMSDKARVRLVDESVDTEDGLHYLETSTGMMWDENGCCMTSLWDLDDLVEYIGPLSPTPACADKAGTPVVSTVSTETAGEQLKRMKQREAAIWRELEIYLPIVDALKAAASDLDEAIKRLENGVEKQASEDHEAAACAVIQDERRER